MTEEEWLSAEYSDPLMHFVAPKVSDRKLHYFAIACARRIVSLLVLNSTGTVPPLAAPHASICVADLLP